MREVAGSASDSTRPAPLRITRRSLVRAGAAAGSAPLEQRSRRVRDGTFLVHADLHNHSLFSDGAGDPALVFESMRAAGLDVAALTDHSTVSYGLPASPCGDDFPCPRCAGTGRAPCSRPILPSMVPRKARYAGGAGAAPT